MVSLGIKSQYTNLPVGKCLDFGKPVSDNKYFNNKVSKSSFIHPKGKNEVKNPEPQL